MSETFEQIQARLVPLWRSLASLTQDEQTIIVVPSLSMWVPPEVAPMLPAYEERYLFLLFLLRQPRARMIYVTSSPVNEAIVDYYLALMPGVIPSHARSRLHLIDAGDGSTEPLTRKILDRPDVMERILALVPDRTRAHIVPFITTELERELVLQTGIPMYGADPRFTPLGTKTGSRRIFAEAGVMHPLGFEDVHSIDDVEAAIAKIRRAHPGVEEVMVKLNEGVSGLGNAVVDLRSGSIRDAIGAMSLPEGTFEEFMSLLAAQGGIVEERITGEEFRSPSVQLRATPLGDLEVLSTHDQLLGGKDGQVYLGCTFPADEAYASAITQDAIKVGERLAKEGVLGRFAIDFVVVRSGGGWRTYAIELNLRKGGTTHPYLTLQFLTDGRYDPLAATFVAPSGRAKFFVATDHATDPAYANLTLDDLFDILVRRGFHFDHSRQTGVVMHMMSALPQGRIGFTAVGDSHRDAADLYERTLSALSEEASRA